MGIPKDVKKLVARFGEQIDSYKSGKYNETQVRREFLDPFWKALGWDVDNEQGHAEAYKDVIHEDHIRVGSAVKAPDYGFRIGGTRKFFLEAKKPSVSIKDAISPAYQIRRYAWNAKLSLSVLSDFEEFAVYDCRIKPQQKDAASKARVFYCTFKEYEEKWDWIESVFSREAVLKGSFDKYALGTKKKRGTAEVDDVFLSQIEEWRVVLAKNLALRNPFLTQRELNFSVQRIIDRIIFLRICEDRGIEDYGRLLAIVNGKGVYRRLVEIFEYADKRYNSGLFHFKAEKGRTDPPDSLTLNLKIDDKLLAKMLEELYYPESPYEFSVFSSDILGQVYERFLGKVIRLTAGHRAVVEDKPAVRKAGGVYYTPKYIVDYIVDQTVGKLLEGITPKKAEKLKILDPACGSGSFLIVAYQKMLDWHLDWYLNHNPKKLSKGKNPVVVQIKNGYRLTINERKRILLNNIFGVDIDSQAVEVTKLSLLLKVLEGETDQTLQTLFRFLSVRALPDLSNNIKCGNSLIGPDFYAQENLPELTDDENLRINVFDWKASFPEIFSSKNPGFDAVIGNPPYVRQELLGTFKEYFQQSYEIYHGVADLYSYFIEKGVSLLNTSGKFSYIVANKWMRANYGEPLRHWMKEQSIEAIIDFGDLPVFEKATTYPCILLISKDKTKKSFPVTQVKSLEFESLQSYVNSNHYALNRKSLDDKGWSLLNKKSQALLKKLQSVGVPLREYVNKKIFRGVLTGLNEAFVIDAETRSRLIAEDKKSAKLIKPFLAGRDVKRYETPKSERFLIFTRRGVDIKKYPAIEKHLLQFKESLMPKPKGWKGKEWKGRKPGVYQWYEIQDSIDYHAEFEKPKILWPEIASGARFTYDDNCLYANNKIFLIPDGSKYLLGLLNSRFLRFFIHSVCTDLQGNSYNFSAVFVARCPIRQIDFSDKADKSHHDRMVKLVEKMLDLNKRLPEIKTSYEKEALQHQIDATDTQIDKLVYELYGLTEKEIRIVEDGK